VLQPTVTWLRVFLTTWLHFDDTTWVPKDEQMKRTLVIVTFDESEGNNKPERIYTVFLGAMVKPQDVTDAYNHYSVLRTMEDNFGVDPIHRESGAGTASVITGIWK
jgi:hypothetical protein